MANTVKMKQSAVAGKVPTTAQLALGELAINTVDGKLYLKKNVSGTETIVDVTAAAAGLTPATATVLGGVKDGAGVSIATDGTLSADVTSVAGRTGAVTLAVADVSGAAPLASPTFTGTPAAPTAAQGTNTTQVATTAFVQAEIAADAAPIGHVGATGTAHGAATTSVAGFMSASDKSKLDGIAAGAQVNAVTSVAGRTGAVTLAVADVSGAAPLASPGLTGTPTAPTAAQGTNSTQVATTAFVQAEIAADAVTKTSSTGAALMPVGTTAQRPTGQAGYFRHNTTTGEPEWFDSVNGVWVPFAEHATYQIEILLIAGGGGGWSSYGGGGGAGGYIDTSATVLSGNQFSLVIGSGGAAGVNGSNTTGFGLTAIGGGRGGGYYSSAASYQGAAGGSGGGGGSPTSGGSGAGGSGTSGQGYSGGSGYHNYGSNASGAGGGGAGGPGGGVPGSGTPGGSGGSGLDWKNLGVTRAAGGNGSTNNSTGGGSGAANSGTGGGGGGSPGSGGSGVVIVRYFGPQKGSGGTVTQAGGYTYHTFNSSGTFTA